MNMFLVVVILFVSVSKHATYSEPTKNVRLVYDYVYTEEIGWCPSRTEIDNLYNETATKTNNSSPSSPVCPQWMDDSSWMYFEDRPYCYLPNPQELYQSSYQLVPQPNSHYEVCTCICENTEKREKIKKCFVSCTKEIYDKPESTCFSVDHRGPCKDKDIVKENNGTSLTCVPICNPYDPDHMARGGLAQRGLCVWNLHLSLCHGHSVTTTTKTPQCPPGCEFSIQLQKCVAKNA